MPVLSDEIDCTDRIKLLITLKFGTYVWCLKRTKLYNHTHDLFVLKHSIVVYLWVCLRRFAEPLGAARMPPGDGLRRHPVAPVLPQHRLGPSVQQANLAALQAPCSVGDGSRALRSTIHQ